MMYVTVGTKRLRCGYTTGTCAAAAARAAAELLVHGKDVPAVSVRTPAGIDAVIDVEESERGNGWARCAVRKDAGDDPDVTDGMVIHARVEWCEQAGVHIHGGTGIGRVTRPGLDQPVGAAAINTVPRAMITEQVEAALVGRSRGVTVTISAPEGMELAKRTFNPRLGIEGGISIIGTSGIVKPMSEEAAIASITLEMRTIAAQGVRDLFVVPGNYGRDFASRHLGLRGDDAVQCSNYFGAAIDAARLLGFERMLIVGHLGKMAKVAGGIMNTHSRVADCRLEVLAAHAALAGAPHAVIQQVMAAATTDAALDVLSTAGLVQATMESLMDALAVRLAHRAGGSLQVEAIVFSNVHGVLGSTPGACALAQCWKSEGEG